MFGLFHAARTIARSPVLGTKEVLCGLPFSRLRRDVLWVAIVVGAFSVLCVLGGTARPDPVSAERVTLVSRPPFWWEWIRNRWPMRSGGKVTAASQA